MGSYSARPWTRSRHGSIVRLRRSGWAVPFLRTAGKFWIRKGISDVGSLAKHKNSARWRGKFFQRVILQLMRHGYLLTIQKPSFPFSSISRVSLWQDRQTDNRQCYNLILGNFRDYFKKKQTGLWKNGLILQRNKVTAHNAIFYQ